MFSMNYLKKDLSRLLKNDDRIFDFIQEYALYGLWFLDTSEQRTCWINPKLLDVLGYRNDTEIELLTPIFSNIVEKKLALDSLHKTEFYDKTFEYIHKNGSKVLMDCKLLNLFDSNGNLYGVLAANTLKKEIDNNSICRVLIEAACQSQLIYIVRIDLEGNYVYANEYYYKIFGNDAKNLLGTNSLLSILEVDRPLWIEAVTKCFQFPSIPHQVILRKINLAGNIITNSWEFTGLVDEGGKVFEILCMGINISEEININNNLSLLSMLLTNMTDLLISIDKNGSISYVSPNIQNIYGLDPTKVIGNQYLDFVYSKDVALAKELIDNTFSTGIPLKNIEFRFTTNSVDWHWANINSSINPENKELILIISDITEKVNYLKQIKKDKLFILESSRVARVGGWEIDIKSFTNNWSEITKEIHEVPVDYVPNIETGINFYKEGESRETIARVVERAINYGEPFDVELQIITAKGREVWVRVIGKADFSNPDKKRIYGIFQDIDEIKK
jgi:PAS domain S-box-containing protein